jgi:hypothetical protein
MLNFPRHLLYQLNGLLYTQLPSLRDCGPEGGLIQEVRQFVTDLAQLNLVQIKQVDGERFQATFYRSQQVSSQYRIVLVQRQRCKAGQTGSHTPPISTFSIPYQALAEITAGLQNVIAFQSKVAQAAQRIGHEEFVAQGA